MSQLLKPSLEQTGHGGMSYVFKAYLLSPFMGQQTSPFVTAPNSTDLNVLRELIEAGKVTPVIDRVYPLEETPAALGYAAGGHARGKVVITVVQEDAGHG